jgi:hypothetical protein
MGAITKLVKALDEEASVRIDMVSHRVEIDSWRVPEEDFQEAIGEAGFTPIPTAALTTGGPVDVLLPLE